VKNGLQQDKLEKSYEGYQLENHELLIYKTRMHIPSFSNLRIIIIDEIHKTPYIGHPSY
jgi:hypothetical protein